MTVNKFVKEMKNLKDSHVTSNVEGRKKDTAGLKARFIDIHRGRVQEGR